MFLELGGAGRYHVNQTMPKQSLPLFPLTYSSLLDMIEVLTYSSLLDMIEVSNVKPIDNRWSNLYIIYSKLGWLKLAKD